MNMRESGRFLDENLSVQPHNCPVPVLVEIGEIGSIEVFLIPIVRAENTYAGFVGTMTLM